VPARLAREILWKLCAIAVGLFAAGVLAAAFGNGAAPFYRALVSGSFGSAGRAISTLAGIAPLLLAGLSVAVPFKGGLFNIGGEGQFLAGALASVSVALAGGTLAAAAIVPLALLAGIGAGALYASIAGWLKASRGMHEVITTIMLNFIAFHATTYLVTSGPLCSPDGQPRTPIIAESARLPIVAGRGAYSLSLSIVLALVAVFAAWWFVEKSVTGFRIRAAGGNPLAASRKGISISRMTIVAMAAGGALGGLAGAGEVLGRQYSVSAGFSPGYGFDGIAVAFLAGGNIVAVGFSALLFAAIRSAGTALQLDAGLSPQMIYVIEALIVIAAAAPSAPKFFARRRRPGVAKPVEA